MQVVYVEKREGTLWGGGGGEWGGGGGGWVFFFQAEDGIRDKGM